MPFKIEYAPKGARQRSSAEAHSAQEAFKLVDALERSDEEVTIFAPAGYEIGRAELQSLAERELNSVSKL